MTGILADGKRQDRPGWRTRCSRSATLRPRSSFPTRVAWCTFVLWLFVAGFKVLFMPLLPTRLFFLRPFITSYAEDFVDRCSRSRSEANDGRDKVCGGEIIRACSRDRFPNILGIGAPLPAFNDLLVYSALRGIAPQLLFEGRHGSRRAHNKRNDVAAFDDLR